MDVGSVIVLGVGITAVVLILLGLALLARDEFTDSQ